MSPCHTAASLLWSPIPPPVHTSPITQPGFRKAVPAWRVEKSSLQSTTVSPSVPGFPHQAHPRFKLSREGHEMLQCNWIHLKSSSFEIKMVWIGPKVTICTAFRCASVSSISNSAFRNKPETDCRKMNDKVMVSLDAGWVGQSPDVWLMASSETWLSSS